MSLSLTARLMGDPRPGRSAADGFQIPGEWYGSVAPEVRGRASFDNRVKWTDEELTLLWKLKAEGKSQTEIAALIGRPIGSVASKIVRTRQGRK